MDNFSYFDETGHNVINLTIKNKKNAPYRFSNSVWEAHHATKNGDNSGYRVYLKGKGVNDEF